jgi:hypothetical protein
MLAVVAPVAAAMVVAKALIFIPMIFKKIIADENKLVHMVAPELAMRPAWTNSALPDFCLARG